jgi:ATP-dependent DNA helicase RecG
MGALDQPLTELDWMIPSLRRPLSRLGIGTWYQLLTHYPRRYEDRKQFTRFPTAASDQPVCLRGLVRKVTARYFGSRRIVEAIVEEEGSSALRGRITCRWFNQFYVQKLLAEGLEIFVYGRPKEVKSRIYFDHPEFEVLEPTEEPSVHLDRITPVYPLTEGLRQRPMRELVFRAVEQLSQLPEADELQLLPGYLFSGRDAFRQIHFADSWEELEKARRQLALVELVDLQVLVGYRRLRLAASNGESRLAPGELATQFRSRLPFELTRAQTRVIEQVRADLRSPRPMARLIQGDVGSGKTVVAAAAILETVEAGYRALFMAPTQVLAEQHYRNLVRWFTPLGARLALSTGSRQENSTLELAGEPDIIVGTHALLYEAEPEPRVGLVVIDEQHKFGVLQRAQLIRRTPIPDLLVLTATPIPRTLAMTLYGDLEVSILDEKPADRRPIVTRVRPAQKIPEAAAFIRERLLKGRQAYIVYPVIEETDSRAVKAATTEIKRWSELLAPARCALLHGRLSADEKDSVLERFRSGEVQALITTTVIEVGIDVPNATVMVIENAERFGLAQLHQLRGRIGRGEKQSYCILLTDSEDPAVLSKLSVLEKSNDGFEIAEADLRLRGPGDLLGTAQSGLPPLRLANLLTDAALIPEARGIADTILNQDPDLVAVTNTRFQRLLSEYGNLVEMLAN